MDLTSHSDQNIPKKRIMFVATTITGGGAERVFLNILNSLSLEHYHLFLSITTKVDPDNIKIDKRVKVSIYNRNHARNSFFQLYKDISDFKPDYIFTSHFVIAYLFPLYKILFQNSFKLIIRIAVPPSEYPLKGIKTKLIKMMSRLFFNKADLIIAQTQFMKDDVKTAYSVDENKIIVVRNIIDKGYLASKAVEKPVFNFDPLYYNIVAAGALYSIKGFDLLIQAINSVIHKIPLVRLYIFGEERYEAGYKNKLQSLIETLKLEDRIFLMGHQENPYPFFKSANLFVLSSRKEGFPNVVLESLYLGTPVVATDCVDFKDVILDGINGYVVPRGSASKIADAIINANTVLNKKIEFALTNFDYGKIFK